MSTTLPYNVADNTLTFFARSRPYEVQKGHQHFDHIRGILSSWRDEPRTERDVESLIALADPREELKQASGGKLEFRGHEIFYGSTALHNLWVDKILGFRDAGMPFDPIFRALEDLQLNPTPEARDRLPIFVERSKLGFLPDGRIAAFKGVRDNFNDVHSNTVNYAVGKTVSIPRAACNADPSQTCVAGLHLGAIDYIKDMGYGWGSDRRMLLCAFWPRHAVAVPTDYRGGKMRVEQLEVLDEVDRKYVDELLNNGQLIVRGYDASTNTAAAESGFTPASTAKATGLAAQAKPGDWIKVDGDEELNDGSYLVATVDNENGDEQRVTVKVGRRDDDVSAVDNDAVVEILKEAPVWFRAKVGDWIITTDTDEPRRVVEVDEDALDEQDESRLKCTPDSYGDDWVTNADVESILTEPPAIGLRVEDGDKVRIEGHSFLRDGVYEVYDTDAYASGTEPDALRVEIQTEGGEDQFYVPNKVIKAIIREEEEAAKPAPVLALPAPATDKPAHELAEVGDTVTVKGSHWVPDGDYKVHEIGDHGTRLRVFDTAKNYPMWIDDRHIVALVGTQTSAPVDTRPLHEQAEVGDTITVKGSRDTDDGEYVVTAAGTGGMTSYRVQVDNSAKSDGGSRWYIHNDAVVGVRKKGTPAPAVDTRPVHERAKVGDRVKLSTTYGRPAGEYLVKNVDEKNGMGRRLRVVNPAGPEWVDNHLVLEITKAA